MRKLLFLLVCAALMLGMSAQAVAIYGSLPDDGIYVEQSQKHTCTLVAATMMLRNYAFQYGRDYDEITVGAMQRICWGGYGLAQKFSVGSIEVTHNTDISGVKDKKAYLVEQLKNHPEGIVVYNANQPHAVFVFGYREDMDTFFCADTTGQKSMRMITLGETLLTGDGQQGKIDRLTKIWHIK